MDCVFLVAVTTVTRTRKSVMTNNLDKFLPIGFRGSIEWIALAAGLSLTPFSQGSSVDNPILEHLFQTASDCPTSMTPSHHSTIERRKARTRTGLA